MTREAREICSDFVARAVVGSLFALLSINLVADFARTHRATGLLLLVSEALVVVLTIVRRRARLVVASLASCRNTDSPVTAAREVLLALGLLEGTPEGSGRPGGEAPP